MASSSVLNVLRQQQNFRMHASCCFSVILCLLIWIDGTQSAWNGPTFPAPRDITSNTSKVAASWANITSAFESYIAGTGGPDFQQNTLADLRNFTLSVGLFSIHDAQAASAMQFHHTGPDVSASTVGVTNVDGDSVYRVGSVTKAFTVLAGILNFDGTDWDRPITDFVPGLKEFAGVQTNPDLDPDIVSLVQWEKVTPRALAAQIGGVPRESSPYVLDYGLIPGYDVLFGLPPVNISDPSIIAPCSFGTVAEQFNCPQGEVIQTVRRRPPVFLPWTSPAYSNVGFFLLGLAIANVTGKPLGDVAAESIFNPLGMTSSAYAAPRNLSTAVIPGGNFSLNLGYADDGGITIGSGGMFSTLNDLSKFGVAVLNSTLLPPEGTRRWLKPVSHTASLTGSVGAPWEIYRFTQPVTGAITEIYTKAGDSGIMNCIILLVPDYGVGFTIAVANAGSPATVYLRASIADFIVEQILPALESQAAYEAQKNFAGTYKANIPGLNSSMILALDTSYGASGLRIDSWISNSTDTLLSPTVKQILQPLISGSGEVAFRSSYIPSVTPPHLQGLIGKVLHSDWTAVDSNPFYAGKAFDHFIFEIGEDETALSILPLVAGARLEKIA